MPMNYYEEHFKGDREHALQAIDLIKRDFGHYKAVPEDCLIYAVNLMKSFYRAYKLLEEKAHFDIYVDIYIKILAPDLKNYKAEAGRRRLLTLLEHLSCTLALYKLHTESEQLYKCIVQQKIICENTQDFNNMLKIHSNRIVMLWSKLDEGNTDSHHLDEALRELKQLLTFTSARCQKFELNAMDFTDLFVRSLQLNTAQGRKSFSVILSKEQRHLLFEAFWELLKALIDKPLAPSITADYAFQAHLRGFYYFMKMDIADNLTQKLSLKYLQICRSVSYLKRDQQINFCVSNLYNLIKLCYVDVIAKNFKDFYERTCADLYKFLTQSGKNLLDQNWFHDFLYAISLLEIHMDPNSSGVFKTFWANLSDNLSLYAAQVKFLYALIKLLTYATRCEFIKYSCCEQGKFQRHVQISLASICQRIYSLMLKNCDPSYTEPVPPILLEINECFTKIIQLAIITVLDMNNECKAALSEILKLNAGLTHLFTEAKNASQSLYFIELAKNLTKFKDHISSTEWLLLLRRLYQLGAKTKNAQIAADLHCCYIAETIVNLSVHTVPTQLHYQIYYFHSGPAAELIKQGSCLLNTYAQSTNIFKSYLNKRQKRLLHWLDTQFVLELYKKDEHAQLFANLAMCSQSKYDFILIASAGRLLENDAIKSKVENIYELLRNEKTKANNFGATKLSRMQHLTLAHAAFAIWLNRYEKQKTNLDMQNFLEDNLTELIIEKSLVNLNIQNEAGTLEIALDALNGFSAFYEMADIEEIPKEEGGFLKWTNILDELTELALYFQLSGYIDYAYEAWSLHYRIAKTINDIYMCMRSLTFLCEYAHLKQSIQNTKSVNISNEILEKSNDIKNMLIKFPELPRRQKFFTLICMCQIAFYYASVKKNFEYARSYLTYVRRLHAAEIAADGKTRYDIVLFTADLVRFRILWKHAKVKDISLITEMDRIIKCSLNLDMVSTAYVAPVHSLLMCATNDFADFTANRLIENSLNGFFAYCLKISVDCGGAFATAKILSKYAAINLQMEYLQRAEMKFLLIEVILGLRNANEIAKSLKQMKEAEAESAKKNQTSPIIANNNGLELVRKVVVVSPKAIKISRKRRISPMAFDLKLEEFLDGNNNKMKEINPRPKTDIIDGNNKNNLLHWMRFILGTMRARFNFMAKNQSELEYFYENCRNWLDKRQDSFQYRLLFGEIAVSLAQYVNFLRSTQKFNQAKKLLELCSKQIENNAGIAENMDPLCALNLHEQLKSISVEQTESKARTLPKQKERFVAHLNTVVIPTTPLNKKSTLYAQLPMTACAQQKKASKIAAFTIYSDRKDMRKAAEKRDMLSTAMIKRKDLKFEHEVETKVERKQTNLDQAYIELSSDEDEVKQKIDKAKPSIKITDTAVIDLDETVAVKQDLAATKPSKTKLSRKKSEDVADEVSPTMQQQQSSMNAIFKTPSTSLPSSSTTASNCSTSQKKRQIKRIVSSSVRSAKESSSSQDEDQTLAITQSLRRLRLRSADITNEAAAATTPLTTSKRRPR